MVATRTRGRAALRLALPLLALALLGSAPAEGGPSAPHFFLVFAAILIAAKLFGELAERIGQPAVLGELIAGVVLGSSVLGIIPADGSMVEIITLLAEVGVAVLLFEIGLETDLKEMSRVGGAAFTVACVGVVVPFLLGFLYWYIADPQIGAAAEAAGVSPTMIAIFVGATLTATSVGITARVLTDLGRMHTREARVIIGAAVVDDVLGLVILAIVTGLAAGAALSLFNIVSTFVIAAGFLVVAVIVGNLIAPRLFRLIDSMQVRGVLLVSAFAFALIFAALAGLAGSAMIIGAFAAGIVLSSTNQFDVITERVKPVADIFTPIFFVSVGAGVDVRLLLPGSEQFDLGVLLVGGTLLVIAIIGKVVSGFSVGWGRDKLSHIAIGVGMIPRGEVGLIFAHIGMQSGILTPAVYGAILIMVIFTTFLAPPLLKPAFARGVVAGVPGVPDEARHAVHGGST
ncbi:MAG: cation:proton antiporter [Candidatus Cloacimonetes bacterium]|nr:cation:proton antiporter [Candidatus Cloacimonadota bacterium]